MEAGLVDHGSWNVLHDGQGLDIRPERFGTFEKGDGDF